MKTLLHPSYFPSIVTFGIILKHDVQWEVWDNFQKQTYRNRCYICTDQGRHMLSIPIKHVGGPEGRQLYRDVRIDNDYPWQRTHWRTLQTAYRASPFFEFFEEDLAPLFEKQFQFLLDYNLNTIEAVCECLQIDMPKDKSSEYVKSPASLIDGRHLINAKKKSNIEHNTYMQVFQDRHGFISNLSILDLLFNEGNATVSYLEDLELNPDHA